MPIESLTLSRRIPYRGGATFGDVGSYEQIEGELHYAVDPTDAANARIVDLPLAPRGSDGLVRFKGAVTVLQPADAERGNGSLLLDVPNRGRRLALGFNLISPDVALADPTHPGDGLLFRRGFALATVGWQWDVDPQLGYWLKAPHALSASGEPLRGEVICQLRPDRDTRTMHIGQLGAAPYQPKNLDDPAARLYITNEHTRVHRLMPRAEWRFARRTADGVQPSGAHVHLPAGFKAGQLYQLVFVAEGAPVVGCGLLAIRDAAQWLRRSELSAYRHVLGYGVSQTGRFLRHFLYEGMNALAPGQRAFDGLFINIAGGQRGDFNHRFAQPSSAGAPSFGQQFPFATSPVRDASSGNTGDLLARDRASGTVPKIFITNTSWEYWRGDASLTHIGPDGRDLPQDADVRIYHFAGCQHIGGVFPPTSENAVLAVKALQPFSIVDHGTLLRAALVNLHAWVSRGTLPPPSRHPRRDDGSAQSRADVLRAFPAVPGLHRLDPQTLAAIRAVRITIHDGAATYPVEEGAAYPAFVSAVDADGNETAGIRLPAVAAPVATHTGWNPRHPDTGAPDQAAIFVGSTLFFPRDAGDRERSGDVRPSVAERYADRAAYLARVAAVIDELVRAGYVLDEDRELLLRHCAAHFDWVMAGG